MFMFSDCGWCSFAPHYTPNRDCLPSCIVEIELHLSSCHKCVNCFCCHCCCCKVDWPHSLKFLKVKALTGFSFKALLECMLFGWWVCLCALQSSIKCFNSVGYYTAYWTSTTRASGHSLLIFRWAASWPGGLCPHGKGGTQKNGWMESVPTVDCCSSVIG